MTGGTPKDVPLFLWLQDKAGIDPARYVHLSRQQAVYRLGSDGDHKQSVGWAVVFRSSLTNSFDCTYSTGLEGKQGLGAVTTPSGPQNYGRLQGDVGRNYKSHLPVLVMSRRSFDRCYW